MKKAKNKKLNKASKPKKVEKPQKLEIIVSNQMPMTVNDFLRAEEAPDRSLVPTKLTIKQIQTINQPTPKQWIKKRKGKGGSEWFYIPGKHYTRTMNFIFGWTWSFEIKERWTENGFACVLGRLIIKDPRTLQEIVTKDNFGSSEIKKLKSGGFLDVGNDYKAAATDAKKKCASELGLFGDIAEMNEFVQGGGKIVDDNLPPPSPKGKPVDYIDLLRDMGKKNQAYHDDDLVRYIRQITKIVINDIKKLSQQQAQHVYALMIQKGVQS